MRKYALAAAVISFSLCLIFWSLTRETERSINPTWPTLRIGYLPIVAQLPLFVAIEEGFFEQEHIEYELARFVSSNDLGNAATAGHIDIMGTMALNVGFDIASVSKKRHLMFAVNSYSNRKGHVTDHILVRAKSDISSLSDLAGKKIAVFPGSVNRILLKIFLSKHGLAADSYEYIEMAPQNWQPSLATHTVDAIAALEPAATQMIKDRQARSIFSGHYADLMSDMPLSAHWISADFFEKVEPAQLKAFLRAYWRAVRHCREYPDSARQHLVKYGGVRSDIADTVDLNPWLFGPEIVLSQIQAYADLLFEQEAILMQTDVSHFVLPLPPGSTRPPASAR